MLIHGSNVPGGAVGGCGPRSIVKRSQRNERVFQFARLKAHCLLMTEGFNSCNFDHCHVEIPFVRAGRESCFREPRFGWLWVMNMSTDSSMRRVQRSPPGSLEIC